MQKPHAPALPRLAALVGSLLLAAGGATLQTQPQEPPAEDPVAGVLGARAAQRKALVDGLIGTWRLTRYVDPERPIADGDVAGVALFGRETMSITVHLRNLQAFASTPDFYVQSGTHYWRIDELLRLQTSTLIGHSTLLGPLVYEPPFHPREFEVVLIDNSLSLTRPNGSRLEFVRIPVDGFPSQAVDALEAARAARAR